MMDDEFMHLVPSLITTGMVRQADVDVDLDGIVDDSLTSTDWLQAGVIIVATIIVAFVANRIAKAIIERTIGPGFAAVITARLIGYVIFLVGLIYALSSLGVRIGPLLGALGLGGLVLALALQRVVENFVGGIILQSRRPFTIGDTVRLGDHIGVVTDIDSRTTVLRGLDATAIRVPNNVVLNDPIVTLTRERLRRSELQVGVAYDSNLERATSALTDATRRVPRIAHQPPPLIVLREYGASSINFTIYYWHKSDVPHELATTHDLMLAVHQSLAATGITIAFPQMVVWPGHDVDLHPYGGDTSEIYTDHPATPKPPSGDEHGGTEKSRWRRLPWRNR